MSGDIIVVGTTSDDPLASDVAYFMGQKSDISDNIALKNFANTEFCPRFLCDENDFSHIGDSLRGKHVVIVSTCSGELTRNARAMRTFLVACRQGQWRGEGDSGRARPFL